MKGKKKLSTIIAWVIGVISVGLVVASLSIEPYWHVHRSVWAAIAIMWSSVGLVKAIEKFDAGEDAEFHFGGCTISCKNHKKKNNNTAPS